MDAELALELTTLLVLLIVLRFFYLIHKIVTGNTKINRITQKNTSKTLICIGSGGHTTEMLLLLENLNFQRYLPRCYIIANNDTTSLAKIKKLEYNKKDETSVVSYNITLIPRSRNVKQSYTTSIFSTLYSILYCIPVTCRLRPDLILCNGPGMCIPICLVSFILKAAFICDSKIVFVESLCRTETFSLTGKILFYFADNIVVQWQSLQTKLRRSDYIGQIM